MVKSHTDIEQSRKLAEVLSPESADMWWREVSYGFYHIETKITKGWYDVPPKGIPSWSLAALFDVIPKHIKDYNVLRIDISDNEFAIWYDEIGYGVNNDLPSITAESAIDACVEMILKLKENNVL